jgi:hypothetical protein
VSTRGLILVLGVPLAMGGCLGLNRIQVFTVFIVNDTPSEVVARDCDDFCSSSPIVLDLPPGSSAPIHRTTNMHSYFSITTPSGGHIGCLDLYYTTPAPSASAPVSHAGRCPDISRIPWTTIALIVLGALLIFGLVWDRSARR